jgi:predicted ATPase
MIKRVEIYNYKSIYNASIELSPFTLLIGANGTGKSNFLQLLKYISVNIKAKFNPNFARHINFPSDHQKFSFFDENQNRYIYSITSPPDNRESHQFTDKSNHPISVSPDTKRSPLRDIVNVSLYALHPSQAGIPEKIRLNPFVNENGSGIVQVLDSLKTGEREDLFHKIEQTFINFIPEIEKLSFIPQSNAKQLKVNEKNISKSIPVSELSDGTKLVLIILTILYQENPPSLICIEEIDRGLHPRLFSKIIELCFELVKRENMPQILVTTHNPYLVDQFKDNEEAVVIVEKEEGQTIFTTLKDKLDKLKPEDENPLGELWYSGFVGGVPQFKND